MASIHEVVSGYLAELDNARERQQSAGTQDDSEILDLVERMSIAFVTALLEYLGDRPHPEGPTAELIDRASKVVTANPSRFVDGAPLRFFAAYILDLKQVLRDTAYLRQGFGRGTGRPKPTDMKWSHVDAVVSEVWGLVTQVTQALRTDMAQIQPLLPDVKVDFGVVSSGITNLLAQEIGPREFMDAVCDLGARETGAAGWDAFRDLPYEDELENRSTFFLDVLEREPPAKPVTGFGVEIAHPSRGGETTADLWLMGGSEYQPNDETWLDVQEYTPREHEAHSEVLASIYRLAYAPGGLGNAAEYTLCLAWGAYFSRACAYRYLEETGVLRVGCRVGFGGGDFVELGWVTASQR